MITMAPILSGALGTITERLVEKMEDLGKKRGFRNPPGYSIVKIYQNTEKSSGDLRRLVITQTLVKKHQLTLV